MYKVSKKDAVDNSIINYIIVEYVRREGYTCRFHLSTFLFDHSSQVCLIPKFSRLYTVVDNNLSTEYADLAAGTHDALVILRCGDGKKLFWSV